MDAPNSFYLYASNGRKGIYDISAKMTHIHLPSADCKGRLFWTYCRWLLKNLGKGIFEAHDSCFDQGKWIISWRDSGLKRLFGWIGFNGTLIFFMQLFFILLQAFAFICRGKYLLCLPRNILLLSLFAIVWFLLASTTLIYLMYIWQELIVMILKKEQS